MNRTNRRYIVTLALVAGGILIFGSLLRPRQTDTSEPVPGGAQIDLSRLARFTARRELDNMTQYFRTVVDDAGERIVELPSLTRSGLVWEPGVVLTARTEERFPDAATLSTPDGDIGVVPTVSGPHLPIAALRSPEIDSLVAVIRRRAALFEPGSWTVALWRRNREMRFAPAHFLGLRPLQCDGQPVDELLSSVVWTTDMVGGGLFDLNGRLIGVIAPCEGRLVALDAESIERLLRQGSTLEGRLLGRYGVRFDAVSRDELEYYGEGSRVIVREVWAGYPADQAGLLPGDILLAVNAEPIGSPAQLNPLVEPVATVDAFDIAVRRQGHLVVISLPTGSWPSERPANSGTGLVWHPPRAGHLIDAVIPGSQADRLGVQAGDRLLRINGEEPLDLLQVQAVLAPDREEAAFVEFERQRRRWGVLLPAAPDIPASDG